jgi:ABC-type branched-subunit amino acid transport system ATPase component
LHQPKDADPGIALGDHPLGSWFSQWAERKRPRGVLLVEQNIELMQRAAQRAYVMDKGRVVATLGKKELLNTELLASYLAV